MSDSKTIITQDGISLTIPTKPKVRLIDLLPSPKDAAMEGTGPSDSSIAASWLYGDAGKCPR